MGASKPIPINDIINSPLNKPKEETGDLRTFVISAINQQKSTVAPKTININRESELPDDYPQREEIIVIPEPAKQEVKPSSSMKVHIRINKRTHDMTLDVEADITNQEDLDAFHEKYEHMMPRKKWLGIF
jgi:16S rRNA U1498 N3-methylase RsmE